MSGARPAVCHLTTVHVVDDPRIFHKECRSLAAAGFDVTLVAARAEPGETGERDGVRVVAVPGPRRRWRRMLQTTWRVAATARRLRPRIYHFHDPELIPAALWLRLRGGRVVYDVHEDNVTAVAHRHYLPRPVGRVAGWLVGLLERLTARAFRIVLAERYYAERFPSGTLVLNYPRREDLPPEPPDRPAAFRVLYTGNVTLVRGALHLARLVRQVPDLAVHVVGRCDADLAARMRREAGPDADRLHLEGEGHHVPYARILERYAEGGWLAGIALFPRTPHYERKELTKFYEYMAAGIPVLCSDFPAWRALVERHRCGLVVDPEDGDAIRSAIRWLADHPEEARAMGRRGREAVLAHYTWDREAARLAALYRELLGQTTEAPA